MKNSTLSRVLLLVVTGALLLHARDAAAQSDPLAFVVNRGDGLDVIDVNAAVGLAPISTGLGSRPTDIVYDERSGRVFVSQAGSVGSYNARLPDGRGTIQIPASGEGSSIALDAVGRRIFVSYRQGPDENQSDGLVNEFSIANAAAPVLTQQRIVPGLPDLQFIAWDALNRRVYVVEDDGRVARTTNGNWTWTAVGGIGVPSPGGILADPNGGVWITGRSPARLVRLNTADAVSTFTMNAAVKPRGLNFDPNDSGVIFIAVDDIGRIRQYSIATNTFINSMTTGALSRPFDVVKTKNGWLVSADRLSGNNTPGNVSINVPGNLAQNTNRNVRVNIEPVSIASVDLARLTADPSNGAYCYRRSGDTSSKTFTLQNTRLNRVRMDLGPVTVGGLNPTKYVITANTCNGARLNWGDTCSFTLRFTATPPSNQPANPPTFAYYPAQVSVTSTDSPASATIGLRADLGTCFTLPF